MDLKACLLAAEQFIESHYPDHFAQDMAQVCLNHYIEYRRSFKMQPAITLTIVNRHGSSRQEIEYYGDAFFEMLCDNFKTKFGVSYDEKLST